MQLQQASLPPFPCPLPFAPPRSPPSPPSPHESRAVARRLTSSSARCLAAAAACQDHEQGVGYGHEQQLEHLIRCFPAAAACRAGLVTTSIAPPSAPPAGWPSSKRLREQSASQVSG